MPSGMMIPVPNCKVLVVVDQCQSVLLQNLKVGGLDRATANEREGAELCTAMLWSCLCSAMSETPHNERLFCGLAMAPQRASSFPPAKSETLQEEHAIALQNTSSESMRGSFDALHSCLAFALQRASSFLPAKSETPQNEGLFWGLAMALQRASSFQSAESETPQEDLAMAQAGD